MTVRHTVPCLVLAWCMACAPAHAGTNWTGFLNDGSSRIEASDVPTRWAPEQNFGWRSTIPGYGQSTPVIWNGTIFVTSSDGRWQERGMVHAFDLSNGTRRWTTVVPATTRVENYFRNSRAAPTGVVDKDRIVAFFPSGDVAALDHAGGILWTFPMFEKYGQPENDRGVASSLAQSPDLVFAVVDHAGPSYAIALRKSDGTVAWKTDRGERVPAWSSPVVLHQGQTTLLIVSSADTVEAYHADTGAPAWSLTGLQGNHIPSATVVDGSVFVGSTQMYHGDLDAGRVAASNLRIDLTDAAGARPEFTVRWGAERVNAYYSSPLAFAGYVYYVSKSGVLYCCDARTGRLLFAERIGQPCWATAIGVTDPRGESLAYFFMKDGTTLVLRPGNTFDAVARNVAWDAEQMEAAADAARRQRQANELPPEETPERTGPEKQFAGMPEAQLHGMFSYGEPIVYAAAIVDGNIVLRTGQQLFCVRHDGPRPVAEDRRPSPPNF